MGCTSSKDTTSPQSGASPEEKKPSTAVSAVTNEPESSPITEPSEPPSQTQHTEPITSSANSESVGEEPRQHISPAAPLTVSPPKPRESAAACALPSAIPAEPWSPQQPQQQRSHSPQGVATVAAAITTTQTPAKPGVEAPQLSVEAQHPQNNHQTAATNIADQQSSVATVPEGRVSEEEFLEDLPPAPPAMKRGMILKCGHVVQSWKNRYFVLADGVLTYYESPSPNPPYGINKKGEMNLRNTEMIGDKTKITIKRLKISDSSRASRLSRASSSRRTFSFKGEDSGDGHGELQLDIKYPSERDEWIEAIQSHIEYYTEGLENNGP